jgi:hypothetical protein
MQATTIGFDIAKSVFQIHGEDASGKKVLIKRLKRGATEEFFASLPPTVIGIEACGSSHHWGRLLSAMGHEVRLIPPGYVKPFVKRNKTDARDAEAICEAIRRPSMKFVPVKTVDQQSGRALLSQTYPTRFCTNSATTPGSASVEVSPKFSVSFAAILRRIRRMILPLRVFGRPGAH